MEAVMDLEEGNINGALIQLNLTQDGIKMHEKQMMDMMNMIRTMEKVGIMNFTK
jgi:hypothetical protein